MKIVVVAGRVARWPWSPGGIVRDLCVGLASVGHEVALVAHSVDDPEELRARVNAAAPSASAVRVRTLEPYVEHHTHWPSSPSVRRALTRMVSQEVVQGAEAVISTTQLLGPVWNESWSGRVRAGWLPVEPSAHAWMRALVRTRWRGWNARCWRNGISMGAALLRHRGVLPAMLWGDSDRDRGRGQVDGHSTSRAIPLDPGGYAPSFVSGAGGTARDPASMRADARRALAIGEGKFALLVSCPASPPMGVGPGLVGLLRACARVADRVASGSLSPGARTPVLMILTTQPFLVHSEELESRVLASAWAGDPVSVGSGGGGVRLLGVTQRMASALAAADAVVMLPGMGLPGMGAIGGGGGGGGAGPPGVHGRLACDALAAGKPLLGAAGRIENAALIPIRAELERHCAFADDEALRGELSADAWAELLETSLAKNAVGGFELPGSVVARVRDRVSLSAWTLRVMEGLESKPSAQSGDVRVSV